MKKKIKRVLSLLLTLILLAIALVGCSEIMSNTKIDTSTKPQKQVETETKTETESESLIPSEGLEYKISQDNNGYTVTGIGSCRDSDIVLPAEYDGKPVTSIGNYAFYQCSRLASIVIPNCVTSIGNCAFYQCSRLASIIIPNCVTSIGDYAFYQCSRLNSIVISNSVVSIGKSAFGHCSKLAEIKVEEGNQTYQAVGNCLIEIASKTLVMGYDAFSTLPAQLVVKIFFAPLYSCA